LLVDSGATEVTAESAVAYIDPLIVAHIMRVQRLPNLEWLANQMGMDVVCEILASQVVLDAADHEPCFRENEEGCEDGGSRAAQIAESSSGKSGDMT